MNDPDTILLHAEDSMTKALDYLKKELRGIRTGRASPALVDGVWYWRTASSLLAIQSEPPRRLEDTKKNLK